MGKVIIVMPAYNAEHTLAATIKSLPPLYDEIILCDDYSTDQTLAVAQTLGIRVISHLKNGGYGANQKTLYREALKLDPEVIIMVHPDNQYSVDKLQLGIDMIRSGKADYVLGSRVTTARHDGMPWWRWVSNRFLSLTQQMVFRSTISEFHSGLRMYSADLLKRMPYEKFSNDFVFDSETIAWAFAHGYTFGEIPVRCYYGGSESSVNFRRSITYGASTLRVLVRYVLGYYKREPKHAAEVIASRVIC